MKKENTRKKEIGGREKTRPLSKIILFCAAVTLFNYLVYLIKLIIFPEQPLAYIITVFVIGVTALPIIFRKKVEKITGNAFPFLKGLFAACLAFYVISFAFMCTYIAVGVGSEVPAEELPDKTVFVVYGAKVNGSGERVYPGNSLRYRLETAKELMEKLPDSVCIVSGGRGPDEARAEADVMKDWLVAEGIDEDRIFVDAKAKNTAENVIFSKEIIERELDGYKIACVSSDFHIPRIQILAEKYDLDSEYYYHASCPNIFTLYTSLVREYMSYGKLIIFGRL